MQCDWRPTKTKNARPYGARLKKLSRLVRSARIGFDGDRLRVRLAVDGETHGVLAGLQASGSAASTSASTSASTTTTTSTATCSATRV
jgi:hypothetical protein